MYNGPFDINQCCTNITVTLKCGEIQIRYNVHRIKPYKSDTNFEVIIYENLYDDVLLKYSSYVILLIISYTHVEIDIDSYYTCT